ncbi:MAG: peroxiredoxin family protein [Anaerolineales bacterium]
MKKKQFIILALSILILSLGWIIVTPIFFHPAKTDAVIAAPQRGFIAPNFTLSTSMDETITLSEYRGQTVLIFLWASWCSVCKGIMPDLQAVYETYPSGTFEILAINTTYQDTLSTAQAYFQSQSYTFPMLLDRDGSVSRLYRLFGLPTSILVGSDGIILDRVVGSSMSEGYLRALLNNLLTEVN